jgi:hypothetical protein
MAMDRTDDARAALMQGLTAARSRKADAELVRTLDALVELSLRCGETAFDEQTERQQISKRMGIVDDIDVATIDLRSPELGVVGRE